MVIQSITLSNFQCYYGECKFEFQEGLNLVIGDNGAGKSKLYDAFYWVLYDQVFDSFSREFKKTNEVRSNLISDKAKALCEPGDSVKAEVKIVVFYAQRQIEYTLTRSYIVVKKDSDVLQEANESSLTIFNREKYLDSRPMVNPSEINSLLRKILPNDVKPYMWFQGEQVNSLIDFKEKSTLTNAINVLSDIREFDFYEELSQRAFEAAEKEYHRELRKASSDSRKSDDLEKQRQKIQLELTRLGEERLHAADNLTYANERKDDLMNKVDDAQKIKDLNSREQELKYRLQDTDKGLSKMKADINKSLISRNWILKGAGFLVDLYAKKYDAYIRIRNQKEGEHAAKQKAMNELFKEFRLPIDVPEPIFVQQMLDKERCLVCDREAPHGSEAYDKIQELLQRSKRHKEKPKPEPITVHDFSKEFKSLYQNGLNLQGFINHSDHEIRAAIANVLETEAKYKEVKSKLEKVQRDIMEVVHSSSIGSIESSLDVVNEFQSQYNTIVDFEKKIQRIDFEIESKTKEIKKIDEELKNLSSGKISPILEEKRKVLEDFRDIAKSTRARVFNRLIEQLEEEANKHYYNMTAENQSVRGRIKLEKQANDNYMPKNLDGEGRVLSSINDSNIILIKLAVIMAIISAKKSSPAADLYPLISDAPTSKFTENYAIGFCRTASQVYNQSIIMSKDFYNNQTLQERVFREVGGQLGSVYIIEPALPPDSGRTDRNMLETNITRLR